MEVESVLTPSAKFVFLPMIETKGGKHSKKERARSKSSEMDGEVSKK